LFVRGANDTPDMGRPAGSTTGRAPPGGYPETHPALTGFLAGFIEGEGCFSISRQPRNTNHRCVMSLSARDDDGALLEGLARSTALGRITRKRAPADLNPQVIWSVRAKADCVRLIELLDAYPLRGRKSVDYAIWRTAVSWWVGDDPTVTVRGRDWAPMIYLKERLTERHPYGAAAPVDITDTIPGLEGDWADFISGFFTAEGSFLMSKNGPQSFLPGAQISVRADDVALLREVKDRLQAGRLYITKRSAPASQTPTAMWQVRDRDGRDRLVRLFDEHPPRGRRVRQYEIWREAVQVCAGAGSRRAIQRRLARFHDQLAQERAYRPNSRQRRSGESALSAI
jgi:hypothetical protein